MNQKTAKHLKHVAYKFAKEKGWSKHEVYSELKKLWKQTPHNKKHTLGI